MDRDEILSLASRVEALHGPSYTVECNIWDAVHPGERQTRFETMNAPGKPYHGRLGPADVDGYVRPLWACTSSIDDAMNLVSGDLRINMGNDTAFCWAHIWDDVPEYDGEPYEGHAKTLPLAICAAALRALAQSGRGRCLTPSV